MIWNDGKFIHFKSSPFKKRDRDLVRHPVQVYVSTHGLEKNQGKRGKKGPQVTRYEVLPLFYLSGTRTDTQTNIYLSRPVATAWSSRPY